MWSPFDRAVRYLAAARIDLRLLVAGKRDPELPPLRLRYVGAGDFRDVGQQLLDLAITRGALKPDSRVLDIGCGAGRLALPLTKYVSSAGRYEGFDVVSSAIRWCRRHIAAGRPNFRFRHVALRNTDYRWLGRHAAMFSFPYDDHSFDCAVAFSVFTHLSLQEIENYLHETYRVLAPGGRMVATFFLLNDESERAMRSLPAMYRFTERAGPVRCCDRTNPALAVAIEERFLIGFLAAIGFRDVQIERGSWYGRAESATFQDLVVCTR